LIVADVVDVVDGHQFIPERGAVESEDEEEK
jgi:hypothetical protein